MEWRLTILTDDLLVYTGRLTYRQGDQVEVHLSGEGDVLVDLVELLQPPDVPGPPLYRVVDGVHEQRVPVTPQRVVPGSYLHAEMNAGPVAHFTFECLVWPTLLDCPHDQTVLSLGSDPEQGLEVVLGSDGRARVVWGAAELVSPVRLVPRQWQRLTARVRPEGVALEHEVIAPGAPSDTGWSGESAVPCRVDLDQVLLAAGVRGERADRLPGKPAEGTSFNGKIDSPTIRYRVDGSASPSTVAWDFCRDPSQDRVPDGGPGNRDATLVNGPTRAVTGAAWSGDVQDWRFRPEEYSAVYFHDDDLDDVRWPISTTLALPDDLHPGFYAVRVRATADGADAELSTCVVMPRSGAPTAARVVVLVPTYTYLAYGNLLGNGERFDYVEAGLAAGPTAPHPWMKRLQRLVHLAGSTYDVHTDGSGRTLSTPRRPLLNLRPDWKSGHRDAYRHLAADLYVVRWLERLGIAHDVVTDHALTAEGAAALEPYDVVITGSHPEYTSSQMYRAMQAHLDGGGSLMYLGGNGFYWVTSESATVPEMVEVRRGFVGTRTWTGEPGESHHASTGELGGLWRLRGLTPHALLGVGFASQGADGGGAAFQLRDRISPAAEFLVDGVDRVIGDRGYDMGAAASDEVDRYDLELGSPPWAHVVASSQQLSHFYKLTHEDLLMTRENNGGDHEPDVRADVVWTPHRSGGSVFAVGSIGWIQAMAYDGFDNGVERLTRNALLHALGGGESLG